MPEVFGQRPVEGFGGKGSGSGVPPLDFGLDVGTEGKSVDVFSKSQKWLGTPPVPNVSSWSSRDAEVIGWSQYVSSLSAWAAQASMDFSDEIQQSKQVVGLQVFHGIPYNPKGVLVLLDCMRFLKQRSMNIPEQVT